MILVKGRRTGETVSWFGRNPAQSNQYCLYCGIFVGQEATVPSDKEHLIGRNFVPTGVLDGNNFNFIFRACRECNGRKANAERHLSSVTLVNSPGRAGDEKVDTLARRKATRDFHPHKKGVPVGSATNSHSVKFTSGGTANIEFELKSPPQVDAQAARLLAFNQIQALFALVTTEDYRIPEKTRLLSSANFLYFGHYPHRDWGNPHLIEIAKRTERWSCPAYVDTGQGYFKASLKRGSDAQGWFWALEWNQHLRVVGAIFRKNETPEIFEALPSLGWKLLPNGLDRIRAEIPLAEEADHLFSIP
jgi:hypothetical protein